MPLATLGFIGFGLYQMLWSTALDSTSVGNSALLIGSTPVFTALVAPLLGVDRLDRVKVVGVAIAFAGVALVSASHGLTFGSGALGDLLTLAAAVAWAFYVSLGAGVLRRFSALRATSWTVAFGALFLAPVGLWQLSSADLSAVGPAAGRGDPLLGAAVVGRRQCRRVLGHLPARTDPHHQPAVPAAGPRDRLRGGVPRRPDPRRPGRGRPRHRRRRARRPAESGAAAGDRVSPDVPRPSSAAMDAAPAVGPLVAGAMPLAILVDYDGTIALTDVGDTVMAEHVPGAWEEMSAVYDAGRMGSRRLMEAEMGMVDAPDGGAALLATAAAQPHDPGFAPFVRRAQAAGIPVEVVSDGFGFYIGPAMASLGLGDVPVVTNRTIFVDGGARIDFPNGHPTCFICGTCKRARVLAHRAAGRAVVFIGDGESDRYAAGHADVIFAKRALVPICVANRWPFRRWTDFAEIDLWLAETIAAWRADPASPAVPAARGSPVLVRSGGLGPGPVRPARARLTGEPPSGPTGSAVRSAPRRARLSGPDGTRQEDRPGSWCARSVEPRMNPAASSAASAGRASR